MIIIIIIIIIISGGAGVGAGAGHVARGPAGDQDAGAAHQVK